MIEDYSNRAEPSDDDMGTWLSIGDLMSALLMIFALILLIALFQLKGIAEETESNRLVVIQTLQESLLESSVDAAVDPASGDVSVLDSVLFNLGSGDLTTEGKAFLDEFIPLYSYVVFTDQAIASEVEYVVIEGHTSSLGSNQSNLSLSLERANSVAKYIAAMGFPGKSEFEEKMLVSGRGELEANQEEDNPDDRRVKFRFQFKNPEILGLLNGTSNE